MNNRVSNPTVVTAAQIAAGIAIGSIGSNQLSAGCISGNTIAANSVLNGHLINGGTDLSSNQVISGVKTFAGNIQFSMNNAVGAGVTVLGTNCPGTVVSAPYTWFRVLSQDDSVVYIPAWK